MSYGNHITRCSCLNILNLNCHTPGVFLVLTGAYFEECSASIRWWEASARLVSWWLREKDEPCSGLPDPDSSHEESMAINQVEIISSSGLRTFICHCRGAIHYKVVLSCVTNLFLVAIVIFWGHFVFAVFRSNFSYFFFCNVVWSRDAFLSFCRPFFLSVYLFYFGNLCLFVIFPI